MAGLKSGKKSQRAKKGSRRSVFHGTKEATVGGLQQGDLKRNKKGKIVSKEKSDAARRRFNQNPAFKEQAKAVAQASAELRARGNSSPSFLEIRRKANQILGK